LRSRISNKLHPDIQVDVVSADFQLKPDIGTAIARQWFEEGASTASSTCRCRRLRWLVHLCNQKDKVALFTGTATEDLTGKFCGPNHVHWTYDSYALATTVARALLRKKLDRWFFIAADYAMGASVGSRRQRSHQGSRRDRCRQCAAPFPGNGDFSSFLLQAQASAPMSSALPMQGEDLANSVKQAKEFNIEAKGCGADCDADGRADRAGHRARPMPGPLLLECFYWDLNDGTRAFTKRLIALNKGTYPAQNVAGAYSATMHYLRRSDRSASRPPTTAALSRLTDEGDSV